MDKNDLTIIINLAMGTARQNILMGQFMVDLSNLLTEGMDHNVFLRKVDKYIDEVNAIAETLNAQADLLKVLTEQLQHKDSSIGSH